MQQGSSASARPMATADYATSLQQLQDNVQRVSPLPNIVHHGRILQSTLYTIRRSNFAYDRLLDVQFVGELKRQRIMADHAEKNKPAKF